MLYFIYYFILFYVLIWPYHAAFGILAPRPGMEPEPPAVEVWSLNHWTTREIPAFYPFLLSAVTRGGIALFKINPPTRVLHPRPSCLLRDLVPSLFHSFIHSCIHLFLQQKFSKFSPSAGHCADPGDTVLIERVFMPFLLKGRQYDASLRYHRWLGMM